MINIVIPMAGYGERFKRFGYTFPKPLIEIKGFPFFYYSVISISKYYEYSKLIFIGLKEHNKGNILVSSINHFFPDSLVILLDDTPPGAVVTSRESIAFIDNDYPVIFNDCDHMFYSEELRLNQKLFSCLDGFLVTFKSNKPCYSYCIKDINSKVIGTREKEVVSDDAIAGVYGFKNIKLFDEVSSQYLKECHYEEFFMSGLYNVSAMQNIRNYQADFNISFGTVDEFLAVKDSYIFEMFKR